MIFDSHGIPLRRVAGFVSRWEPIRKALPLVDALMLVGFTVPLEEDEEEESDAAPRRS